MTSKLLTSIAALTALAVLLTPPVWAPDGKAISYRSDDETVSALLYAPPGSGPFPALIAIHAIGGLDDWVKEQASKLAGEGYLTLAVDLYRGKVASGSAASMAEAREIARSVPAGRRERDLQAAFDFLLTRPDVLKDRIGAIGWCIGGSLSIRLASLEPGLKVVVAHYPTGVPQDFETLTKIKAPVLLVLGGKDTIFPLENGRRFEQEMKSLGKRVVTVVYPDTGHAFEMPWSSQGYRPEDSADAWKQTIAFLHETSIVGAELGSKDSDRDCNAAAPTLKQDDANHAQDEAAIRKIVADVEAAWNRRDPDGMAAAAHLTEGYDHINVGGHWTSGKLQVQKAMTDYFQTHNPPPSAHTSVERIRFITPEVAICVVRNQYSNDKRTWEAMSTLVLRKMNAEWWNEAFQNTLIQSREEAIAQAARASSPMAQTEPEVITPYNSKIDFSADVALIRKRVADAVDAWNRRDAKALAAHISEDHDHIGVTGGLGSGKAQIEKGLTAALAATRNNQRGSVAKIRFITSEVAIVIVRFEYSNDKETLKSISTSVLHKMNGEWWNEAFQNTYVRPAETTSPAASREQHETVAQPATENPRNSPAPNTQSASSPTSTLPRDMIFDNPQIRIRDIKKEPRQKTAIHSVPPLLIVALTPVHNLLTLADGSTKEESITAGDVAWWNGGERGGENLEDKPQEFLTVFPKEPEAGAADVTLPLGELGVQNPGMAHAMIFDNDRFRVSRMSKLPRQPGKLHDAPGRLLVFLTDGHLRCTFPNRPAIDNVAKPGDVAWWPPGMHVSENVGEQEVKFLLIVPKLQNYRPSNP